MNGNTFLIVSAPSRPAWGKIQKLAGKHGRRRWQRRIGQLGHQRIHRRNKQGYGKHWMANLRSDEVAKFEWFVTVSETNAPSITQEVPYALNKIHVVPVYKEFTPLIHVCLTNHVLELPVLVAKNVCHCSIRLGIERHIFWSRIELSIKSSGRTAGSAIVPHAGAAWACIRAVHQPDFN